MRLQPGGMYVAQCSVSHARRLQDCCTCSSGCALSVLTAAVLRLVAPCQQAVRAASCRRWAPLLARQPASRTAATQTAGSAVSSCRRQLHLWVGQTAQAWAACRAAPPQAGGSRARRCRRSPSRFGPRGLRRRAGRQTPRAGMMGVGGKTSSCCQVLREFRGRSQCGTMRQTHTRWAALRRPAAYSSSVCTGALLLAADSLESMAEAELACCMHNAACLCGNGRGHAGVHGCLLDGRHHVTMSMRCVALQAGSQRPPPETKPKSKAIKCILNQMTWEKYDKLFAKMLAAGIGDATLWDTLIHMVRILL